MLFQQWSVFFQPVGVGNLTFLEAALAAVTHDVGRFPQIVMYGGFDDAVFDHGIGGSVMVMREISRFSCLSSGRIGWAVIMHNQKSPKFLRLDPLVLYIRDADKLAILRDLDSVIKDLFGSDSTIDEIQVKEESDRDISEAVYRELLSGSSVDYSYAKSAIDKLVVKLAWIFDLYNPTTKEVFINEQIPQKLLCLIEKINAGRQSNQINQIRLKIEEWIKQITTSGDD